MITTEAETRVPLSWVTKAGKEAIWAWENSPSWRANAAQLQAKMCMGSQVKAYMKQLIDEAKKIYHA